ncbi:MAG TPA: pentapeptide repeat-containing protein [Blastocatellia bacterium]|nr:pentapeptide repeat-containing protein [Blastocatellia bacterium]
MANAEHLDKILQGVDKWNVWRRQSGIIPDLIAADLSDQDLAGIDLTGALLDGTDFRRAHLREAVLRNVSATSADFSSADASGADLSNSKFHHSSFSGTTLARITAPDIDLTDAVITNCDLSHSDCRRAVLDNAKLINVSLSETNLESASLVDAVLTDCRMGGSYLSSASIINTELQSCNLDRAILSGSTISRSSFLVCSIRNTRLDCSRIEDVEFSNTDAVGLDLSSAILVRPSLDSLNLHLATLFNTRIVDPMWTLEPIQSTLLGAPIISDSIFSHSVQDIMGLTPSIRRRVADAQLIMEYWNQSSESKSKRLIIRLWGITCNYGQSIARWTIFTCCVLFIFATILTRIPFYVPEYEELSSPPQINRPVTESGTGQQADGDGAMNPQSIRLPRHELSQHIVISKPSFFRSLCFSAAMFTTLGFSEMSPASNSGKVIVVALVMAGYVMLGALISILANKLARLS